jgi:hypothetical protein
MASIAHSCFRAAHAREKREEKLFPLQACNPLKRLDSQERIQGNPTLMRGVSQRNSEGPRKPKRIDWADVAGPLPTRRSNKDKMVE